MSLAPTSPVEGLRPPDQGPETKVKPTRPKLRMWDRIKFIVLFTLVWFILVWAGMAENPLLPFVDSMREQVQSSMWLLVLIGLEILRQFHFFISEHSSGYHRFWTHYVFGGSERYAHRRLSDWTRYRISRTIKWIVLIVLFAVITGAIMDISPVLALFRAPAILWGIMPMLLQVISILLIVVLQFVAIFWFLSRGGVDVYYPDDIKTRFTDVWGQDHVLARVKENIVFLERPEEIEAKGGYVPSGLLLWGPPGTGKTLMAEAVAGETGKPYVFVDPGAFTNMFMGVGILKVKSLFRKLRKLALRYGGVIVFFDEADSLGNRGMISQGPGGFGRMTDPQSWQSMGCHGFSYLSPDSQYLVSRDRWLVSHLEDVPRERRNRFIMGAGMGGGAGMGTLQALLTELSGLKKPRGFINRYVRRLLGMRPKPPPKYRILVMMATNLPEALDEALLRPGRIDRIYKVGYPSKAGRVRTYEGYFNKVRHELALEEIEKLAVITPYATGATIKDLVNEALIMAIRDGREIITWKDVVRAKQLKQLGPPEDVEYIERERHAVAVHEACHAIVSFRMVKNLEIDIATIEKGSTYLGMVASIKPDDQFSEWKSDKKADIMSSLASLAGERIFFENDNTTGVSGDLEHATLVATHMEGVWGMGLTVSSYAASRRLETGTPGGGGVPGSGKADEVEKMRRSLADRIEDNLAEILKETDRLLKENRREILSIAHALEAHKTLTGDDVAAVIECRMGATVDGRPYGDGAFQKQIEAYHRAVVVAHQAHSKIALSLPLAPDLDPPVTTWTAPVLEAQPPNGPVGPSGPVGLPSSEWSRPTVAAPAPSSDLPPPAVLPVSEPRSFGYPVASVPPAPPAQPPSAPPTSPPAASGPPPPPPAAQAPNVGPGPTVGPTQPAPPPASPAGEWRPDFDGQTSATRSAKVLRGPGRLDRARSH